MDSRLTDRIERKNGLRSARWPSDGMSALLVGFSLLTMANAGVVDFVEPVDWGRIQPAQGVSPNDAIAERLVDFLQNSARYNAHWADETYALETKRGERQYRIVNAKEYSVRPLSHIAWAMSSMLQTGIYDEAKVGMSESEFRERNKMMIRGLAYSHQSNRNFGSARWGAWWQTALWSAQAGEAAWMVWDDLSESTRQMVATMVAYEADRFLDYRIPYWANSRGVIYSHGNTRAEENAWNSRILSVAAAMMPSHPHARQWRQKGSQLMVSAYSRSSDLTNEKILDGRPVKDWINGYNARDDGLVVNHKRVHNDYAAATSNINKPFITQSLANQSVPEAAGFNADLVYRSMATVLFSVEDGWRRPGGTMFRRDADTDYLPEQYYPQGWDWSPHRYELFLLADLFAEALGFDHNEDFDATGWAYVRLAKLNDRQARHEDGHLYARNEHRPYIGSEAYAFQLVADSWMLYWMDRNDFLNDQDNWIENPVGLANETDVITTDLKPYIRLPGDANEDRRFDIMDVIQVLGAAKYETGEPATWAEGDWDGAPSEFAIGAPKGNGLFDSADLLAALAIGGFEMGTYASLQSPYDGNDGIVLARV